MINCKIGDLCNHGNSIFKRCCEHSYCFKIYQIYVFHNSFIAVRYNLCKEKLDNFYALFNAILNQNLNYQAQKKEFMCLENLHLIDPAA